MRRSKLEMYVDILKVLAHRGPLKLTHVMYKANVNCSVLKEYLDFLMKQGLVEERKTPSSLRNHPKRHNSAQILQRTETSAAHRRRSQKPSINPLLNLTILSKTLSARLNPL
jgi:hypothetical protein